MKRASARLAGVAIAGLAMPLALLPGQALAQLPTSRPNQWVAALVWAPCPASEANLAAQILLKRLTRLMQIMSWIFSLILPGCAAL